MLGRSLRKLLALLFILLGAMLVSTMVDTTPGIGSPQIDYPGYHSGWPFWPQFTMHWVLFGLGGGLMSALGMTAWSDEAVSPPNLRRLALIWVAWFALVGGLKLAGFLAWGTMGPLGVRQPIFRFALLNGLVSAMVITSVWAIACALLARPVQARRRLRDFALTLLVGALACTTFILAIALGTGLPWGPIASDWAPAIPILVVPIAILLALTPRRPLARA